MAIHIQCNRTFNEEEFERTLSIINSMTDTMKQLVLSQETLSTLRVCVTECLIRSTAKLGQSACDVIEADDPSTAARSAMDDVLTELAVAQTYLDALTELDDYIVAISKSGVTK